MALSSKTGLLPIQRNFPGSKRTQKNNKYENLLGAPVSKPVEFSIRPLAGLYNPYSKACSVLCNHPAPAAVRNIIKQAKDSLSTDNRIHTDNQLDINLLNQMPQEYLRRYLDTDSRPATPTTASRISSFLNTRRCVTPEPGNENAQRKQIILDLRRSHSQETLNWRVPSDISQQLTTDSPKICQEDPQPPAESQKPSSKTLKTETKKTPVITEEQPQDNQESIPISCINERDPEDIDYLQRRGKRRKKSKALAVPSATFRLSQDPETQVSTLGPDSVNASTRPSLVVPDPSVLLTKNDVRKESQPKPLEGSFLSEEAFNVLKVELDIDTIENTFERFLNRARREAMKFLPKNEENQLNKDNLSSSYIKGLYFEKDIKMPRKLSKSSSRFEMPIHLKSLESMTVFQYLSQHVWITRQRKQLYKRTFLKYVITLEQELDISENNVQEERVMLFSSVSKALEEVLGFYGTTNVIEGAVSLIFKDTQIQFLNFRSWCGVVAFAERFALTDPSAIDSCDELEKADFETMEERIDSMNVSKELYTVLFIIRKGHCCHN